MSIFEKIDNRISKKSNLVLLIFVFLFIFVLPFFPIEHQQNIGRVLFSLIFFASIFVLNKGRQIIFYIAFFAFITEWISGIINLQVINYVSLLANILFFQIIAIRMIIQIAKSKDVNERIIFESINGYLMLGLMFTVWVSIAMLYDPNSFNFGTDSPNARDYTYFTFVTMTTLGYGEITPVAPFARSISILISTSGQIYIAVIIAMLVGKYAGSQKN